MLRVRHGPQAVADLWQLLAECEIEIIPFDEAQVHAAAAAFGRHSETCGFLRYGFAAAEILCWLVNSINMRD
jgi:hypothetical protein